VVNSASYEATLGEPGSIATIFGANLATTTVTAQVVPLPKQLGGTTVTWNGVAAALFFVSPTQINFQVPSDSGRSVGVGNPALVVSTTAGNSTPYVPSSATPNAWNAAGLFSMDGTGCGQGAVLNVANDGSLSLNSPANSASPGGWISVYGTGVTPLFAPPDGVPTPASPLLPVQAGPSFDLTGLGATWPNWWSGLAPGFVGVDQFNTQIPPAVREGCAVPIQVQYTDRSAAVSQPVTLAIRQGGGPCVDPPSAGYGQIFWQKTVATTARTRLPSRTR
jgi:adhesin/invasin